MTRNPWTSVPGPVSAAILCAFILAPGKVLAAPLLPPGLADPNGCTGIVATPDNCAFADLGDALLGPWSIQGQFAGDADVVLFQFLLSTAADVSASALDDLGLDPLIGIFHRGSGDIVRYFDTSLEEFSDAEIDDTPEAGFDAILPVIRLDPGTYVLALLHGGNTFSGLLSGRDNLGAGFSWDSPGSSAGFCTSDGLCDFTVSLTAMSVDAAAVPEPGTLTLMALGAGAAAFARRRRARR